MGFFLGWDEAIGAANMNENAALSSSGGRRGDSARPLGVILLAACLCTAVYMRFPYLNGPWYYAWNWQRIMPRMYMPLMAAAGVPLLAGLVVYDRTRRRDWGLFLILLGLAALTLTVSLMQVRLGGFERTIRIVRSPGATSYFTAARQYLGPESALGLRGFLAQYPQLLPGFFLHAQTKPPGPILYYALWIKLFGPNAGTSLAAGLFFIPLMACSVLATEKMVRTVTGNVNAGIYATACLALCPGTIVFYPGFDAVYPAITCAMVTTWVLAVRTGRKRYAVWFGASLALAMFWTYVLLLLGAFLAGYALVALRVVPGWNWRKLLRQSAIAVLTVAGLYGLSWVLTGYNPIAAYLASKHQLAEALTWVKRPYPLTIGWDLHDFALGMGWIPILLAILYLFRRGGVVCSEMRAVTLLVLGVPIVVAVSHLVPGETARCWQLLFPLVLIPAGAELARWDRGGRFAACFALLVVLIVVSGRMSFISVEPLDKLAPGLL